MTTRTRISRRAVLRGMAGGGVVTVGLPMLEAMLNANGTALADGKPIPVRLLTYMWAHGVSMSSWTPTGEGQGAAWSLSSDLASLAPVKDYVTVVTGTNNPTNFHEGAYGLFSGHPTPTSPTARPGQYPEPSIDVIAARDAKFDPGSGIRSLHVGTNFMYQGDPRLGGISFAGSTSRSDGAVNLPDRNPQSVFDKLFRGFSAPATTSPQQPTMPPPPSGPSQWVIDAVQGDLARLGKRVSASDRARIDDMVASIHDLEKRLKTPVIGAASGPGCRIPPAPAAVAAPPNNSTLAHDQGINAAAAVMSELVALAFACDRTRIITFCYTTPQGRDRFAGYTTEEHNLSHTTSSAWYAQAWPRIPSKMQALATLLQRLTEKAEGAANVLHNTVLWASTDCEAFSHSGRNHPMIIAGRAGGRIKGNMHVRMPGASAFVAGATVREVLGVNDKIYGSASPIAAMLA